MSKKGDVNQQGGHRPPPRRCVAVEQHNRLVRTLPGYAQQRRQIEREIQDWVRRYGGAGARTGLIRIPVVVHVLHNTAAQDIPDTQIQSQIAVLNRDFRRLNTDATSTPAAFLGVAADARLEFALAVRDPDCNPTTGITRTSTTVAGWTFPSDAMKSASSGGHDPWDTSKYLNVWIVNYTDGTLGYGTFPGMPANIQGVVCDFRAFGDTGALTPNAALGRTMTHEIGHWLNLNHIWGDDGSACIGTDNVSDTPNQAGASPFGPCRAFPALSCSNGPNGDMFMNYMDYSADQCMNMFTAGQVVRMDAALHTQRQGILASDGLVPPTGVPGPDLWMKDVSSDMGDEPDTSAQPMYISDDIWVRKNNDGLLNQDHENPEYRSPSQSTNFVYVRVRNRACSGTASGTLRLYWAKASSGLSWPSPWDGSVTAPALMGGSIGSQSISVAGGDTEIYSFPWAPPNPADYASFGADQAHFCLLARIETEATSPYGMTFPETSNLYQNVQRNNNIVWKNVTIVDEEPNGARFGVVTVANFDKKEREVTLELRADKELGIFDWGDLHLELPRALRDRADQERCKGLQFTEDGTIRVTAPRATLGVFRLEPGEVHALQLEFTPRRRKQRLGVRVLTLDLVQRSDGKVIGGQRFVLKTRPDPRGVALEKPVTWFDGVSCVPIGEVGCGGGIAGGVAGALAGGAPCGCGGK